MRTLVVVLAVLAVSGCGSELPRRLPPAAAPAGSPQTRRPPAGRVVPVGREPEGIAFTGSGRIAVALRRPSRLAIVDAASGRVLRRARLPGAARHISPGAVPGTVLVPAETADRLLTVRADGRVVGDVRVGRSPHDATAAGGRVFVADERGAALSVVRQRRLVRTLPTPLQPGGIAATADGRLVAVVSVRERMLTLYDAVTLRRLGALPAGIGPTHVVVHGGLAFVVDTRGGTLLVFSLRPRLAFLLRANLRGAPYGIALGGGRLWVTLTARNEIVEVTADRHPRVLRRLTAVRQPDSVAVDPRSGRVAVTGSHAGVLQLLDPSGR